MKTDQVDADKNLGNESADRKTDQGVLRLLDLEIAERVMGFCWFHCVAGTGVERNQFLTPEQAEVWRELGWNLAEMPSPPPAGQFSDDTAVRHYSTGIAAAMEVVEKMQSQGCDVEFLAHDGWWYAVFKRTHAPAPKTYAPTLPEAICRAALKATELSFDLRP